MSYTTTLSFNLFSVPVVQKTVGQYAKHIVYYSETKDSSIPTEDIGVPNTESGRSEDVEEGSRDLKQRQVRLSPFLYAMELPKLYNLHSCRADLAENLGKIVAQECKSRSISLVNSLAVPGESTMIVVIHCSCRSMGHCEEGRLCDYSDYT